jgi:hypothetical protein
MLEFLVSLVLFFSRFSCFFVIYCFWNTYCQWYVRLFDGFVFFCGFFFVFLSFTSPFFCFSLSYLFLFYFICPYFLFTCLLSIFPIYFRFLFVIIVILSLWLIIYLHMRSFSSPFRFLFVFKNYINPCFFLFSFFIFLLNFSISTNFYLLYYFSIMPGSRQLSISSFLTSRPREDGDSIHTPQFSTCFITFIYPSLC